MAFNAGAIVSKLKLDTTNFSKGVKGAKGEAKGLGGFMQKNAAQFKKAGMAMTIAGAAIIGTFAKVTKTYIEMGDWIDKMSKRTGFSATALSELAYAADISGASLDNIEKSLKKMSMAIVDADAGLATYLRYFDLIGVSVKELRDMKPEDQFMVIGQAISDLTDETLKTAMAAQLFGRAGVTLLPLFKEGKEGIKKLRLEAHELGIVFDKEAAAKAALLKDKLTAMKSSFQGVGLALAEQLVPAITSFVGEVTKVVVQISKWAKAHPGLFKAIVTVVGVLGGLMAILGPLLIMLPFLVSGITMFAGAFIGIIAPIGLVVAAVGIATVTFLKLKDAQDEARKAGERYEKNVVKLKTKLQDAAKAAGLSSREWEKLTKKYKDNFAALAMAIHKGKEGVELQKALAEVSKKSKKAYDEQKKSTKDLTGATKGLTKETGNLIEKLEFVVPASMQLAREFAAGKISILEYTTGMRNLRLEAERIADPYANLELALESSDDAFADWGESTEGTMGSVLDSVNLWNQDSQAAYDENAEKAEQTAAAATAAWEEQNRHWLNLIGNMAGSFGNAVEGILSGSVSLKEGLAGIWTDIKNSFFSMVGDMAAEWAITFLKDTLISLTTSAAKEAGESIVSNLGGAVTEAGKAVGSIAEGIAGAVVSLAKGIASAAKIIAGSAKEILIAAAVVAAIYAGFKLIGKIFGGGGKSTGAQEYMVKILEDMLFHLGAQSLKMDETNRLLAGFYGKYDAMLGQFYQIRSATQGTLKALTSQGTVYVNVFESAIFESVGEKITASVVSFGGEQEKIKEEYGKKSDEIIKQLDLLEKQTAVELKELQTQLMNAEGREREKLQAKMEQLQKESQQKRSELINQLKTLEKEQKKAIEDMSKNIKTGIDGLGDKFSGGMADLAGEMRGVGDKIGGIGFDDRGIIDAINKGRGGRPDIEAQHGALITEPTLAMVGEDAPRVPELIAPVPAIASLMAGAGGKTVNVNINIPNQLDPYVADKISREVIVPAIHRSLDSNYLLDEWRNKLRIKA